MGNVIFKAVKADEVNFTNRIETSGELNLSQKSNYSVTYSNDMKSCRATLIVEIEEKTRPNDFRLRMSITAFFACEDGMTKNEIHKKTYDEIYPNARVMVMNFLINAGLPPIVIPKIKMTDDVIKSNEDVNPMFS